MTERPMEDVPGVADEVGPDGGATPTDVVGPGAGSDEDPLGGGSIDPQLDPGSDAADDAMLDDAIGLGADDEILR